MNEKGAALEWWRGVTPETANPWQVCIPKMSSVFPDGVDRGEIKIDLLVVSEEMANFSDLRAIFNSGRGRVEAETYCRIFMGDRLWMSDTPDERGDHSEAIAHAAGRVLIGGLGFGMVALAAAMKTEVREVIVVEISQDVIDAVSPWLDRHTSKITYVCADMLKYKPPKGEKYHMVWFDIWPTLCEDDLEEHAKLNRRWCRHMAEGGWRGCWGSELLKRRRDQGRRRRRWW